MADNKPRAAWRVGSGAIFSPGPFHEPCMLWKQTDGGYSALAQSLQGAMAAEEIGLM